MSREQQLEQALLSLMRGYVSALENGRDRILMLGGQCDPVEVMERSDPHLREARVALGLHPCGHMKGNCPQCHQCLLDKGEASCPVCEPAYGVDSLDGAKHG
jgi:hypothetical protein